MNLRLVGLNHKTAPLDVRERLHLGSADLARALALLDARPGVRECFILSTCNRVEVLAEMATDDGAGLLVDFLCDYHGQSPDRIEPHLYRLEAARAIGHLFRVTASLDSMVIGEPQIVAQVREAVAAARAAGTLGPVLGALVDRALAVSKRIRSETGIAENAVSISYAAVELARKIFGDLDGRRALLMGAGEMSELAAKHLVKHGVADLAVANRSPRRAEKVAEAVGGRTLDWDAWPEALVAVDIVIASTSSPHTVVGVDPVHAVLRRRRHRPIFFIDIAVPRDVDPAVNDLDNVYLYDVDDLQVVVAENVQKRSREAEAAEKMVAEEARRFVAALNAMQVGPTIAEIRQKMDHLRADELARIRATLNAVDDEHRRAVEAMARSLTNKLLHGTVTELKRAARSGDDYETLRVIRRLFGLEP